LQLHSAHPADGAAVAAAVAADAARRCCCARLRTTTGSPPGDVQYRVAPSLECTAIALAHSRPVEFGSRPVRAAAALAAGAGGAGGLRRDSEGGEGNAHEPLQMQTNKQRARTHTRAACAMSNAIRNRNDPPRTAHDEPCGCHPGQKKKKNSQQPPRTRHTQAEDDRGEADHRCDREPHVCPPSPLSSSLLCRVCGVARSPFPSAAAVVLLLVVGCGRFCCVSPQPAQLSSAQLVVPSSSSSRGGHREEQRREDTQAERNTRGEARDGCVPRHEVGYGTLFCAAFERKSRCALAGGWMLGAGAGARWHAAALTRTRSVEYKRAHTHPLLFAFSVRVSSPWLLRSLSLRLSCCQLPQPPLLLQVPARSASGARFRSRNRTVRRQFWEAWASGKPTQELRASPSLLTDGGSFGVGSLLNFVQGTTRSKVLTTMTPIVPSAPRCAPSWTRKSTPSWERSVAWRPAAMPTASCGGVPPLPAGFQLREH
jgi:hypothetical protein